MILIKTTPFTKDEIEQLRAEFDSYIKTVIDIEKNICSAGCNRHFESEKILLEQGSKQEHLWGGGVKQIRELFDTQMKSFFQTIYGQ